LRSGRGIFGEEVTQKYAKQALEVVTEQVIAILLNCTHCSCDMRKGGGHVHSGQRNSSVWDVEHADARKCVYGFQCIHEFMCMAIFALKFELRRCWRWFKRSGRMTMQER